MNNSTAPSIGPNKLKLNRERSLKKMTGLIKQSSWGVENTSIPYVIAASLFVFSPLTSPLLAQLPAFEGHHKLTFFTNAFLFFIAGVVLVNVLRSKFLKGYFTKTNADLFIDELRNFNPIAVDNLDSVCETIKKQDYNGHWVGYALNIINAERHALLNA